MNVLAEVAKAIRDAPVCVCGHEPIVHDPACVLKSCGCQSYVAKRRKPKKKA